jgi:cytochrome c556
MHPTDRRNMTQATLAIAAALALAACATMIDTPPENPQRVVDERVRAMKSFGGALAATANYAQDKASAAEAKTKLAAARANLERVADLFPKGTALGDKGVTQSRALSTIFTNRGDFEDKLDALGQAFATLDAALAKNTKSETMSALAPTRAACTACHNKYRAPEE